MELVVATFWILILNMILYPVTSESALSDGFVSIDCGGDGGWDKSLQLNWTTDDAHLQAASHLRDEGVTVRAHVTLGQRSRTSGPVDNEERLKTALVFYPGDPDRKPRSKYCYVLLVNFSGDPKYLLRATFPSRQLKPMDVTKDKNGKDISFEAYSPRFYFSVDSTYVATIELDKNEPQTIDLIITPFENKVYVCLVPLEDRSSLPAISALELRGPFPDGLYTTRTDESTAGTTTEKTARWQASYFMMISRLNFGGRLDLPSLRYPIDKYDRLWSSPRIPDDQLPDVRSEMNSTVLLRENKTIWRELPVEVMSTAWVGLSSRSSISYTFNFSMYSYEQRKPSFFYRFYFCRISGQTLDQKRLIDVSYVSGVDGNKTYTFNGLEINNSDILSNKRRSFSGESVTFTFERNHTSNLNVLINAAEMYGEFTALTGRTFNDDDFRNFSKFPNQSNLHVDMAGDPCLPIPWTWITCSIEFPPRVTQVNLSGIGFVNGLPDFNWPNRLTVLDLSNNNFTGPVRSSLGSISTLRVLNLERNKLSGDLSNFTQKSFKNLEILSLSSNQLKGSLDSLIGAVDDTLTDLNLSNNSFNGYIPKEITDLKNLKTLDLSNNEFSGELIFQADLSELQNLQILKLSYNKLSGKVPDSVIWSDTNTSLESVNLSNNNFTEVNLTMWFNAVLDAKSFDVYKGRPFRKVRLMGNQISNIIIDSSLLLRESTIRTPDQNLQKTSLENPQAFILLTDNRWCEKNDYNRLFVRYLCRKDEHDNFWNPPDGNLERSFIIVIITAGLLILLISSVFIYYMRKTLRRNRDLHRDLYELQKDLDKADVNPPYLYEYEVIREATGNFSRSNMLGEGSFGTVYKAVMKDELKSVLAVKKLKPNVDFDASVDFRMEVVNITGIQHKHLIQLKGCCLGKNHQRILVYEYAENRSLAEALWGPSNSGTPVLSWQQRFKICLGIARGLAYLNDELHTRMVHRDIKPQNILLDKEYNAKIADFGLVRPSHTDEPQYTAKIKGTTPYMPVEYLQDGLVTEKLDAYSYGVVLLEIVSGRRLTDQTSPRSSKTLRDWAMQLCMEDKLLDLVDGKLKGEYDTEEVLVVLKTAIKCCQHDYKKRPTMSQVVNMLMKHEDVPVDIVQELKAKKLRWKDIIEEDSTVDAQNYSDETEEILLIPPNSLDSSQNIQLILMRPR